MPQPPRPKGPFPSPRFAASNAGRAPQSNPRRSSVGVTASAVALTRVDTGGPENARADVPPSRSVSARPVAPAADALSTSTPFARSAHCDSAVTAATSASAPVAGRRRGRRRPRAQGRRAARAPARHRSARPQTVTPQSFPPEQVQGRPGAFRAQCGFCHGRDAAGGESGPDLTRSALVRRRCPRRQHRSDRSRRPPDKGMPPFTLSDTDLIAIVAFIHDAKAKAERSAAAAAASTPPICRPATPTRGRRYFNGAGGCATCHR